MTISRVGHHQPIQNIQKIESTRSLPQKSETKSVEINLSSDASWIQSLKREASLQEGIRMDEVEKAKREIAMGTLEKNIDMDAVLDALIMEL